MEFRLLGPLELVDEGRTVALPGGKPRALLALLLLEAGTVVSVDRLIDGLWGDRPPVTAPKLVQGYVAQLRKLLPDGLLVTRAPGYVLRLGDDQCDLRRFERLRGEARSAAAGGRAGEAAAALREALALWRGPPLSDVADQLEVKGELGRLEELRLLATEERVEAELMLGLDAELVPELEGLVAAHPLRERLRGQLMLALYRAGRQAEALASFRAGRSHSVEELGLEPGPELHDLERRILAHDPGLMVTASIRPPRTELPAAAWPLVGRTRELGQIMEHVASGERLLTLTGAGGSGKTRLALEAAGELSQQFAHGSIWVSLAPLAEAALVPAAVATALELGPQDELYAALADRQLLIVLDNAEHLSGIEQFVAAALDAARTLVFLVTSRAPLHLAAERQIPVEPLEREAAVELFLARASAVGRSLYPEDETVGEICRRLDDLPLALELAAARTKMLSPQGLLERLERALPLLTDGARDAPQRQRTLAATIDWSHELLSEDSRTVFRRLAVFRGGFSLDAAEAVAEADLDQLADLVDHSLLKPFGRSRFLMLEVLREYALARLDEAQESDEQRLRHGRFYLGRFEEIAPVLRGPRMLEFLDWYDDEAANTWAALDELLDAGEHEEAFRLAIVLTHYWVPRNRIREARAWLAAAVARATEPSPALAHVLAIRGDLAHRAGDMDEAWGANEEALRLAIDLGAKPARLLALRNLARLHHLRSDHDHAIDLIGEARGLARELDDDDQVARLGQELGAFLSSVGRHDEAEQSFTESLAFFRRTGDELYAGIIETGLVSLEIRRGRFDRAEEHGARALRAFRQLGSQQWASDALGDLALTALATDDRAAAFARSREAIELALGFGDRLAVAYGIELVALSVAVDNPLTAAQLWGATDAFRQESGVPREEHFEAHVVPRLAALRRQLGDAVFERALRAGAALPLDDAATLSLALPPPAEDPSSISLAPGGRDAA